MSSNVSNPTYPSKSIINENYKNLVYNTAAAASLAAISLLFPCECLKIVGTTILSGMGYGVANNLVSAVKCPEYFTVDRKFHDKKLEYRLVRSLNPFLNAVVWGSVETWKISLVAGAFFAIISRIPLSNLVVKITVAQLGICFGAIAIVAILYSQIRSKNAQKEMEKAPWEAYREVPLDMQHKWEGCYIRKKTSNNVLGLGALITSIGIAAIRTGTIIL